MSFFRLLPITFLVCLTFLAFGFSSPSYAANNHTSAPSVGHAVFGPGNAQAAGVFDSFSKMGSWISKKLHLRSLGKGLGHILGPVAIFINIESAAKAIWLVGWKYSGCLSGAWQMCYKEMGCHRASKIVNHRRHYYTKCNTKLFKERFIGLI